MKIDNMTGIMLACIPEEGKMKRYMFTLATVIASMLVICASFGSASALAASKAEGDAPYRVKPAPKPVPPICTPTRAVAVAGGVATLGICKDAKGNKVYGGQFLYKDLAVTGLNPCAVKSTFGSAGSTGLIKVPYKGVSVSYTITMWVAKSTKHLASVKTDPRSTRTFSAVRLSGSAPVCAGTPEVDNSAPNSPTGSGNGGDAAHGWRCGFADGSMVRVAGGVQIQAPLDCSGNGVCAWVSINGTYTKYGIIWYPGRVVCGNDGIVGIPLISIVVNYPDSTTCRMAVSGVDFFPLPTDWYGDATFTAIMGGTGRPLPGGEPQRETLVLVLHGTGTTRLC